MTEEQEKIAEKIIAYHKEGDGVFNWEDLYDALDILPDEWDDRKKFEQIYLLKSTLTDNGFITTTTPITSLTDKGWKFKSFDDERAKQKSNEDIEKLSMEKLRLEVEDLRNKFFDFEKTRTQSKNVTRAQVLTAVLAGLSLLLSLMQWMCNKSG
jgi:hypothetical protein